MRTVMPTSQVREVLGRLVRRVWTEWASEQVDPKSSWLVSWEQLSEPEREVDRRIGEVLWGLGIDCAAAVCRAEAEEERVYAPGEQGERFAHSKERCAEAIVKFRATGLFSRLGGPYADSSREVENPLQKVRT
jgi:hypothetical protein